MPLIAPTLDYTDRDFASLVARLRSLIRSTFTKWSDEQVANFANLLVEMYAFVGDVLGVYQDNQANEAFPLTCTQRKNMLALCRRLGYRPGVNAAAEADVTFTLAEPVPAGRTVTLSPPFPAPANNATTASTEDAVEPKDFQLLAQVVIGEGETGGVGTVRNSAKGSESFISSGQPNQSYRLANEPYVGGSAVVTDDVSGSITSWTEVPTLVDSTPDARHFVVVVDENDRATIQFGNGVNGAVPSGTITVVYETGGGAAGNVAAGTITKLDGSFVDSSGATVTLTVTNPARAEGGDERQSIESMRELAPRSVHINGRSISREDFEINAMRVGGIARALMLTRNEDPVGIANQNQGSLYCVPTGIGFPTQNQLNSVLTMVTRTYPSLLTFQPSVVAPVYIDVGFEAVLHFRKNARKLAVKAAILAAVRAHFALRNPDGSKNEEVDFGYYSSSALAASDILGIMEATAGVDSVETTTFRMSGYRVRSSTTSYSGGANPAELVQALAVVDAVTLEVREFPRLKAKTWGGADPDVVLLDGDNGNQEL